MTASTDTVLPDFYPEILLDLSVIFRGTDRFDPTKISASQMIQINKIMLDKYEDISHEIASVLELEY